MVATKLDYEILDKNYISIILKCLSKDRKVNLAAIDCDADYASGQRAGPRRSGALV
jgi:hypothetical protein